VRFLHIKQRLHLLRRFLFEAEQLWCVIHGVEMARGLVDALLTEAGYKTL